jgi:17beta-estradiol 17-dehydrogenase / very-long-chain 3-oxoacyl-CoA reductase
MPNSSVGSVRAGLNVILVSRTESKLTAVATDIEARYGVQTKVVPADFAAMDDATWEALDAVLGSVPLGVLVNSAGDSDAVGRQVHHPC